MGFKFTVKENSLSVEFDAETIPAGLAILRDNESALGEMAAFAAGSGTGDAEGTADGKPPRKGRGPNKPKTDPAAVTAPPPLAIPGAAPPPLPSAPGIVPPPFVAAPPVPPGAPDIPPFLDAAKAAAEAAAAAPPPPPPAPPAPPPPPAPPANAPGGPLVQRVVANLEARAKGAADKGQSLVDWLAAAGVCTKSAKFDEAISVLKFNTDEQIAPYATALGIS